MSNRRNLVIVRAGDSSIHPEWLNAPGEERNWDLIVSYFGDNPDMFRGGDWLRIDGKGPKLRGVYNLIHSHEQLVRQYEYVCLAEEDLQCTCHGFNRIFEVCRERRLKLAQPSLTHDSYCAHAITLHSPSFRLRFTTFVEQMIPCMDSDTLWRLLPTMNESVSCWGVEFAWAGILASDPFSIAIIDEVQIRHTRPLGSGTLYDPLKANGISPWDEYRAAEKKYGITSHRYWIERAVRNSGREVNDGLWLLFLYGWGLLTAIPRLKQPWTARPRFCLSAIYQQLKGRPRRATAES
jgi:hypothetical protein